MSLTLIIILNAALDGALLAGLASALARPARLAPHLTALTAPPALAAPARRPARRAAHAQGASDWRVRTSRAAA